MAFKLTKDEQKTKDGFATKLREAAQEIQLRKEIVDAAIAAANDAITAYSAVLADVETFIEERKNAWQSDYEDKTDRWKEGEKGEAAASLIEQWDTFDTTEIDPIDDIEVPDLPHADELDGLPSETA